MKTETHAEKVARLERRLKTREGVVTVWTKKVAETRRELEEARKEAAKPVFDRGDLVRWGTRDDRFLVLVPAPGLDAGYAAITNGTNVFVVSNKQLTKVGSLIADSNKAAVKPFDWKTRNKTTTVDTRCRHCGEVRGRHQADQGYCPTGEPVKFAYQTGQTFEPEVDRCNRCDRVRSRHRPNDLRCPRNEGSYRSVVQFSLDPAETFLP